MQFTRDAPVNVVEYFNANWHPIHEEWVLGLKAQCGSFLNKTNNRIECINAKLKQVISRNSSLEEFVENFFIALTALHKGVDQKAAAMIHKTPVRPWNNGSPESNYTTLLTPYAVNYVVQQLQRSKAITHIVSEEGKYYIQADKKMETVTVSSCSCIFTCPCNYCAGVRLL